MKIEQKEKKMNSENLWSIGEDCLDRNGYPKKRYYRMEIAEQAAVYLQNKNHVSLRVYHCEKCGYFHLTKNQECDGNLEH